MGYERPVEVISRLRGIGKEDKQRILQGNAARLLRL
jgi:hypothetical protein